MRTKDPALMNSISNYVDQYYSDKHVAPSTAEIADELGIAKATAYRYLVAMDEQGMLQYDGPSRTIVTKKISKFSASGITTAPVVGAVPCGTPEEQEENVQEYVSLPVSLFGKGEFYILKASGDSMVDAGIEDGDMVVIRRQKNAEVGDIVVALDENACNTLKVYEGIDRRSNTAILGYRNEERYPEKKIPVRELVVQGVAKHVIKTL